jgi:rod shape-determining protein MreD
VATFVVSRAAGVRLAAQTLLTKVALAFVFGLVEGVLVVVLTAIFGTDAARPRALALLVAPHAVSTALFAPLVFRVAERVHQATITCPGRAREGTR